MFSLSALTLSVSPQARCLLGLSFKDLLCSQASCLLGLSSTSLNAFGISLGQVSLRPARPAQVRFRTSLGQISLRPLLDDVDVRSPLLIHDCFSTVALLDGLAA